MRKVFSYFVLALCLLVSTQVKAVNVSTEAQLRSAIEDAAPGATVDITLSSDIALDAPLQIAGSFSDSKKTINLNLNGKTLSNNPTKNISVIELFKGELNIENGTIKGQYPSKPGSCKDAIVVHGVYQDVDCDWAVLNIKKDAKVLSDKNAITVLEFWGPGIKYPATYFDNEAFESMKPFSLTEDGVLEAFSGHTWNAPNLSDEQYTALSAYRFYTYPATTGGDNPGVLDKDTTVAHGNQYNATTNKTGWALVKPALSIEQAYSTSGTGAAARPTVVDYTSSVPYYAKEEGIYCATTQKSDTKTYTNYYNVLRCLGQTAAANGVKINIDGYVYGAKYGIKVNGTVRLAGEKNPCKVSVSPSGEVACSAEKDANMQDKESTAIYCSGTAEWEVSGYIHGNIGMVVKSGKVEIENATIEATGTAYEAVTYEGGSGLNGGAGCAIVIASQKNYSGGQDVTIKGDTKISANTGFAVNEVIVNGENKTSTIAIEGGTFESGAQGTMLFTNETVTEGKISIMGGNVGEGSIYQGATEITLETLLEKTAGDHYVTEIEVDDEKIFVINNGTEPATTNFSEIADNGSAVVAAGTATLSADKKFGDLQFTNATTLTINNNVVMQAEKIVMGPSAQIIVTPGAKLFVTGSAGLYAPVDKNLVIKADENGMGMFLFDPAVSSNRTPHATVEVYADEAYSSLAGSVYGFEIISCPFSSVSSITYELDDAKTAEGEGGAWSNMQIWKNNNWVQVTRAEAAPQLKAFQPIAMTSSADPNKGGVIKYTFKGVLQGNVSGIMPIGKNFNYMGNAYLAPMSSEKFIEQLKATDMLENNMWFWKGQGFQPVTADEVLEAGNIAPMGMFILKSKGSVNYEMDYETLIWNLNKPAEKK